MLQYKYFWLRLPLTSIVRFDMEYGCDVCCDENIAKHQFSLWAQLNIVWTCYWCSENLANWYRLRQDDQKLTKHALFHCICYKKLSNLMIMLCLCFKITITVFYLLPMLILWAFFLHLRKQLKVFLIRKFISKLSQRWNFSYCNKSPAHGEKLIWNSVLGFKCSVIIHQFCSAT